MNYGDLVFGVILIFAGLLFLIGNYTGLNAWQIIWKYWPAILIIIGIILILKGRKKKI